MSFGTTTDQHGKTTGTTGINGTLLADNNLSYNVQESDGNHGTSNSGNANMSYQGTYGNLQAGYNYSDGYHQVNYGVSGGLVVHRNGVTLSQPLGDTNILVKAPGAAGVELENATGVKTDWRGYAVIPYATTYRQNRVALDTNSMGQNVDIEDAVTNVVPTQGALVRAEFNAHVGVRALMTLMHNGKPVPFGATVSQGGQQHHRRRRRPGLPRRAAAERHAGSAVGRERRTALRGEISTSGEREAAAGE